MFLSMLEFDADSRRAWRRKWSKLPKDINDISTRQRAKINTTNERQEAALFGPKSTHRQPSTMADSGATSSVSNKRSRSELEADQNGAQTPDLASSGAIVQAPLKTRG